MNWFLRGDERQRRLRAFLRKYRLPVLALAGAVAVAIAVSPGFARFKYTDRLEQNLYESHFFVRGRSEPSPQIVIVGLDADSLNPANVSDEERAQAEGLQLMGERPFPWNRKVFALLIEKLIAAGARVVALDFIYAAPNEGDAALAETIRRHADKVVLASTILYENEDDQHDRVTYVPPNSALIPADGPNVIGLVMYRADSDGTVRRINYRNSVLRENGTPELGADDLTAFSALAVEKLTGQPAPALHQQPINFQGQANTYPVIPFQHLFLETMWNSPALKSGAIFRDKIVFVGPVAALFHDVHRTPYGEMPGVEIHAHSAADLLAGTLLREAPPWTRGALTVLLAVLALLVFYRVESALWQSALLAGLGACFFLAAQYCFVGPRLILPMAAPLTAFVASGLFGIVYDFALTQWERARVRSALDRYVSKNVAEMVLANPGSFEEALRGKKKRVTTLFSDIRGFTSMTEAADADELVNQLNEYFLRMVDVVLKEGGTLQKFIGDAIMAVWGDTHSESFAADALGAVRAALQMRARLAELNRGWEGRPNRPQLKTGLGIANGEVVVGNIGHPLRMEFTVLGDGVNTAARLESATKQFGCDILVEAGVEQLTREHVVYRRVDLLRLKGKMKSVEVFTPLSDRDTPAPAWLAEYHRGIALFRGGSFAEARAIFEEVNAALGGEDFLCEMYLARCAEFSTAPPPQDWDGSRTLTEK